MATSETRDALGASPAFVPPPVRVDASESRGCLCPGAATNDGSIVVEIVVASLTNGQSVAAVDAAAPPIGACKNGRGG
jgi:hypothetical protein